MYTIYDRYDVLPKLNKISNDIIFRIYNGGARLIYEKNSTNTNVCEHVCLSEIKQYVLNYLVENHPSSPIAMTLEGVLKQIPEDLVIHRLYNEVDWLAYANVCFANGWSPEISVGKSYKDLHNHVPNIDLSHIRQTLSMCVNKGPFERFVWGVFYEKKFNHHPNIKHKTFEETGEFFIKVERQVIVGMPQFNAFMFILRPCIVDNPNVIALYNTVRNMSDEQKKYKGITDGFIKHLEKL